MRGPQRSPAGAYRREKFCLVGKPKEALELACKVRASAVLDQRRRAHHTERRHLALLAPGDEQRIENLGCNIALIKREPDLYGNTPRCRYVSLVVLAQQFRNPEVPQLTTIGVGSECKATRRRQTGMRQGREVGRLRSHPLR